MLNDNVSTTISRITENTQFLDILEWEFLKIIVFVKKFLNFKLYTILYFL